MSHGSHRSQNDAATVCLPRLKTVTTDGVNCATKNAYKIHDKLRLNKYISYNVFHY